MEWANKPSHGTVPAIEANKETYYPDNLENLFDDVDAEEDEEKDPGGPGQVQGVDIPLFQGTGHLYTSIVNKPIRHQTTDPALKPDPHFGPTLWYTRTIHNPGCISHTTKKYYNIWMRRMVQGRNIYW
jgi:hypothetical protein